MFLPPYCNCHHFSFHVRSLTLWTYIGRTIRQTVSAFSAPGTWSPWKLEGREDGALEVICSKIKDLVKEQCKLSHNRPPRSPPRAALTSSSAALEEASRRLGSIAGASGQSALSLRLETIDKDSCISPALESEIKAPASTKGAVVTDSDCNELVRFLKGKGLSAIAPRFSEVMGIELVHHFGKLQAEDFDDPELSFLKRWKKQELIELVQGIAACSASLCLSAFASASTTTFVLPPTRQVRETTRGDGYSSGRRFREATGRRSGRSRAFISEAMAKAEADGIVQGIRIC